MSSEKRQKHDNGYKGILSDKKEFWHFLRKYVGGTWTKDISLESMEKVNKSYVTDDYKHLDSDLIYKQNRDGREVYFYVLVELQSSVDYTMPFRLLKYMVALLSDVFKNAGENERERKDYRLPAIVPIVLYNGDDNWTVVKSYKEYTKDYEIFGNNIIDFNYILFDLKRMDEETILSTKELVDIAFLLDKMYDKKTSAQNYIRNVSDRLEKLMPELPPEDRPKLAPWVINRVDALSDSEKDNLINTINKSLEKGGNNMKHALDLAFERLGQERAEERAIAVAKRMLDDGEPVEKVVKYTGLDLNTVLKMQY